MQLHMILKFGSFVVLLDPLKIFQNLVVQMFDIIFTANQNLHNRLQTLCKPEADILIHLAFCCLGGVIGPCDHYITAATHTYSTYSHLNRSLKQSLKHLWLIMLCSARKCQCRNYCISMGSLHEKDDSHPKANYRSQILVRTRKSTCHK